MIKKAELLLDCRSQTGEGPLWDVGEQVLWWTDIPGRRLHRFDPVSGLHRDYELPARVGCFALRAHGGLVLAMEHEFGFFDPESASYRTIVAPEAGMTGNRFNDGRCDRRGRFFAGSMYEPRGRETGLLWRFNPDHKATRIASGVTIANGLAWSPDDRFLYWADTVTSRIWRFDYDIEAGSVANQSLWNEGGDKQPGLPDGAAVDLDGCYWSARYLGGAVIRYSPDGRVDRVIEVPTPRVTMCAFGGPMLQTLYITTAWNGMTADERARDPYAGGIFAIDAGVAGLPEPHFAG